MKKALHKPSSVRRSDLPKRRAVWQDMVSIVDPQINAAGVHVWPFDPAFPVDIRFLRAASPHNIRMNRHRYCEVLYVCQGQTAFNIHDRQFQARQGDLVVIGTQLYHGAASQTTVDVAVLYFEPEVVTGAMTSDEHQFLAPFFYQPAGFPHVIPARTGIPERALDLMQNVYQELGSTSGLARLSARTYLKMLLMLLVKYYAGYLANQEGAFRRNALLERFAPLFAYVEDRYGEGIRIAEAASVCGMSESHLMYLFREATGQSFVSYLNRFRIAKAQDMLATSDASLAAISQLVGFCSQSHFGQVFRKLIGETPNEYRARLTGAVRLQSLSDRRLPGELPGATGRSDRYSEPTVRPMRPVPASPPRFR